MAAFSNTRYPAPGNVNFEGTLLRSVGSNIQEAKKVTQSPITTGTSVIGIKFDGGVILAADKLGSYGSLARYPGVSRTLQVNSTTALVASGDYADFQTLKDYIESLMVENDIQDDGHEYSPASVHAYLRMLMYYKRSRFDPFWNTLVIGGRHQGKSFLGYVDKIGTAYEENCIATGYGAYIAIPLIRKALDEKPNLTKVEAVKLIINCLKILFYRDARAYDKFDITVIDDDGVTIETDVSVDTNWEIAHMVKGYE